MVSNSDIFAPMAGGRWYAVQMQPRRERLALWHLQNQRFETFCPMRRRLKHLGRHRVLALEPLFPGYGFVRLDLLRDHWRSINGTIGVSRIVSLGRGEGGPSALPEGLVERLRFLTDTGSGGLRCEEELSPGDKVRIVGGPFDKLIGTLESAGDSERVTILLDILAKETRVWLSKDMLLAA